MSNKDDSFGVLYLLIGAKHAPLLAVSIHSLRQHYTGPIAILSGDSLAADYSRRIAADPAAGDLRIIPFQFVGGQRGSVYAAKIRMFELSPFERTVFLDADTVVAGDFSALCPTGNEVRLTQFADWQTTGRRMRGRLLQWKDAAPLLVSRMVSHGYPAINTGCLGFSRACGRFFEMWQAVCERRISFICDEIACQLVYPDFPHKVLPDAYNYCPFHSRSLLADARVLHFHGGCQKIHSKPQYRELWWPAFTRAGEENFGGVREWGPGIDENLRMEAAV